MTSLNATSRSSYSAQNRFSQTRNPRKTQNVGAESIRSALISDEQFLSRQKYMERMDKWAQTLSFGSNALDSESTEMLNSLDTKTKNLLQWYREEQKKHGYRAPNFRVSPERTALFAQFKNDPYYHLKNVVEIVARTMIEDMLKDAGMNPSVQITSDADDVFGGVDCIVTLNQENGEKEYIGIDVAVSSNERYLEEKALREETVCYEFNHVHKRGKLPISRQVVSFPPKVMVRFLDRYLETISSGYFPNSVETVQMIEDIKKETLRYTVENTKDAVNTILH